MFARNYKNKPVSSLLAGLFLFEHKYVLIKTTRYNKLGNDLIGGKVLDFKQLENKFEKKKVNTFLVYQKGELTTEYYKTPECANNLYKINSITKALYLY